MASAEVVQDESGNRVKDRHLLLAVEGTESSERAVLYVADFLGESPGLRVTLFHVIALPRDDEIEDPDDRVLREEERKMEAGDLLGRYREILIQSGFPREKVRTLTLMNDRDSVADLILRKQAELGSCTIVVGRRQKSREEEFLFGSVSSRIVRQAAGCSVWVIE